MAINAKGSRKIVIDEYEFRWRATGNDGFISLVIWPVANDSLRLVGFSSYHHDWRDNGDGSYTSNSQIVITNRIVKAVIEHYGVDELHQQKGQINIGAIEDYFDMSQAVRSIA